MRGEYIFFGVIVLVILSMIGFRGYMINSMTKDGKHLYEISIPGNKRQETNFFTNSYIEKDGCVIFKDEFGRSHRICGVYNITEY